MVELVVIFGLFLEMIKEGAGNLDEGEGDGDGGDDEERNADNVGLAGSSQEELPADNGDENTGSPVEKAADAKNEMAGLEKKHKIMAESQRKKTETVALGIGMKNIENFR